jgi:tetratricopeptide (TPR) repeat protein
VLEPEKYSQLRSIRMQRSAVGSATLDTEHALAVASVTHGVLAHHSETAARIERLISLDPRAAIGHAVRGLALSLQMRTDLAETVATSLLRAETALHEDGGTDTEHALVSALRAYAAGRPFEALASLDAQLAEAPTDLLTLKLGHALHFLVGDTSGMRRAVDAAVRAQPTNLVGRGFALGCQAFAWIESGDVDEGERIGRAAVERQPDDAWGAHAVAHALATRQRASDGIAWLRACAPALEGMNNFGGHVAWHEALCHLALGEDDAAIALYDSRIAIHLAADYRDMANAATLLHRLRKRGHDVRDRAARLATHALRRRGDHGSAFGDLHYALAIADHDVPAANDYARSMRDAATERTTHEASVARRMACDLADGIVALASGARASHLFERHRSQWAALGGSRIQRETLELLLEEALAMEGSKGD